MNDIYRYSFYVIIMLNRISFILDCLLAAENRMLNVMKNLLSACLSTFMLMRKHN